MPEIRTGQPQERKPSLSDALSLSDRYGGIDNIPQEELRKVGYELISPGHIVPIEIAAARKGSPRKNEGMLSLEEKAKNAPFGEIGVVLSGKDVPFRRLSEKQVREFGKRISTMSDSINLEKNDPQDIAHDNIPAGYPFHTLLREFERFTDSFQNVPELKTTETNELKDSIFYWWSLHPVLTPTGDFFENPDMFISDYRKPEEEFVSAAQTEIMHRALERQKGILADRTQLDKHFVAEQSDVFPNGDEEMIQNHYPSLATYCRARGLTTNHAVTTHFFGRLLNSQSLTDLAQELERTQSTSEAAAILTTKLDESLNSLVEEEKKLRANIKTVYIEEKKTISGRLKAIKEEKEKKRAIVDGMIQYFTLPELTAEIINRKIKRLQDFLVHGKGVEAEIDLYLNGQPNPELDRDPGEISGDCTAGLPLPFADPKIPVYNVKVLSEHKEHIGNIYLLVTSTTEEKRPIWHLEAIQIPQEQIEWGQAIPQIIEYIGAEAKKKDVAMITTNSDSPKISNYDYIAKAVQAYWEKQGEKETYIDIPEVDDQKYSPFQATGDAKILWVNESQSSGR